MGESDLHAYLKQVGAAFLMNQDCFLVDTEVRLCRHGQQMIHPLDDHHIVDVCGVGERFYNLKDNSLGRGEYEVTRNILRGIEVKVSRSDFRNGFICTACNYNYLLTPMRLVAPWEVPKGVGLIEYNKYKFKVELTEENKFKFEGLRVVKKSQYRTITPFQVDNTTAYIARRRVDNQIERVLEALKDNGGMLYPTPIP